MSTPSERLARAEPAREVCMAQQRLGDRGRVDDVVRAGDARLDALHVHGSLVRGSGLHVDAAFRLPHRERLSLLLSDR
jgi:hypothetical protein